MTEDSRPKRRRVDRKTEGHDPLKLGYRASKRTSKVAKKTKAAVKIDDARDSVRRGARTAWRWLTVGGMGAGALVALLLVGALMITGINGLARWYAKRQADEAARTAAADRLKENVLFIGVQGKQAVGFLALRVDRKGGRVFGLAIPDGAFVEVPGMGFERIGDSMKSKTGTQTALAAVANYLGVPFERYVVIDADTYRNALKQQSVAALMSNVQDTNLDAAERSELGRALSAVESKNVGLAPLPVREVSIGKVAYFEPQRDQIADLLYSWWGVRFGSGKQPFRVILYNGAGVPGIAGVAAQRLIKNGYRVVDTGNADRMDYKQSQIVLFHGDQAEAKRIRDILGVGEITQGTATQNITDAIIVIGKDFKPSGKDG